MARPASVKMTLENGSFINSLKDAGNEVDKVGKRGQKAMSLITAGMGGAKKALGNLGSQMVGLGKLALSFGGAFTMGNAVKSAVQLKTHYAHLAFEIQKTTGRLTTAADVQKIVERSASQTGRTNEEVADSFSKLRDATGDVNFARAALDAVGTTVTGVGVNVDDVITLTDQLHTKFGVTADGMQDALAKVWDASKRGGPSFAGFADTIETMGAEVLAAGLNGEKGLNFLLGTLVGTDDAAGGLSKQVRGLRSLLRGLGEQGELKKLAATLGISSKSLINEKDAMGRLRRVLSQGKKGSKALLDSMHEGEEKETIENLFIKPFQKSVDDAEKSGLKGKAAIDKALVTFDGQIADFGKSATSGADIVEEANKRRQDPEQQLTKALNTLNTAFAQPEIINAINDLAKHLPPLAAFLGDIVSWAAKHPITSAVIGGAGIAGKGFLSEVASAIIAAHVTGAGAAGKQGGKAMADEAVAGLKLTGALGETISIPVKKAFTEGALAAAPIIGAAVATAWAVGKEMIDSHFEESRGQEDELRNAAVQSGPRNAKQRDEQVKRLEKSLQDSEGLGDGFLDKLFGTLSSTDVDAMGNPIGTGGPDSSSPAAQQRKMAQDRLDELRAMRFGKTDADHPGRPVASLKLEAGEAKTIGESIGTAVKTALGGMMLPGGGRAPGPGGSRSPLHLPPTRPGGGV